MKETFAGRVREKAKFLARWTLADLGDALGLQEYAQKRKVEDVVGDMRRRGEVRRIARGQYEYLGRNTPSRKHEIMWRFLRSAKSFGGATEEELREAAEASAEYVSEWLQALMARGAVTKSGKKYQVAVDTVEPLQNEAKMERLRRLREKKKQKVLAALAKAKDAVETAEALIRAAE